MGHGNRNRAVYKYGQITVDDTRPLSQIVDEHYSQKPIESTYDGSETINCKLRVHVGDITDMCVDAIVTSTQTQLTLQPVGLSAILYSKAGPGLQNACIDQGYCEAGATFLTPGYDLVSKYVLHTAGPPPDTLLKYTERKACLTQSYLSCLQIVKDTHDIRTVAFPCLGSGGAGINVDDAIRLGLTSIRAWLEEEDNRQAVDQIILCMYNDNQWTAYLPQLLEVFPSGKDIAGLYLEKLALVTPDTLTLPSCAVATPIMCYKYEQTACRLVTRHFHKLVDICHSNHGNKHDKPHRYRDCAMFQLCTDISHQLTIYHSPARSTVEIQLINYTDGVHPVDHEIWHQIQRDVHTYLQDSMNNNTQFVTCVRCTHSTWGATDKLWTVSDLEAGHVLCHHTKQKDTHTIDPREMLKCWPSQTQRRAREHSMPVPSSHVEPDILTIPGRASSREPEESSDTDPDQLLYEMDHDTTCIKHLDLPGKCNSEPSGGLFKAMFTKLFKPKNYQVLVKQKRTEVENEDTSGESCSQLPSIKTERKSSAVEPCDKLDLQSLEENQGDPLTAVTNSCNTCISNTGQSSACPTQSVSRTTTGTCSKKPENRRARRKPKQQKSLASDNILNNLDTNCNNTNQTSRPSQFETLKIESITGTFSCLETNNNVLVKDCNGNTDTQVKPINRHLSDQDLFKIAKYLGDKQQSLGLQLGLRFDEIRMIQDDERNALMTGFSILNKWRCKHHQEATLNHLLDTMQQCDIDTFELREYFKVH